MPFELFLALRHLRSRHKRRLARTTTVIAVAGISLGVGALIVAMALGNGFRDELRDKILRGTAHLTVMRKDGQPMPDYADVAARVRSVEGVRLASATTYDGAVIIGPTGSAYAILRGVDAEEPEALADLRPSLIEGAVESLASTVRTNVPAIVGSELAARTGLRVGDRAEVILASSGSNSTRQAVHVTGISRTGLFEYDSTWVYLPLDEVRAMTTGSHLGTVISVQASDIYRVKEIGTRVRQTLGNGYTTVDWQEANRPLFTALALERRIGFIIIALLIFIAALNITTTLILVVLERRRDIAILSAMGAARRSITSIFVIEGLVVGIIGAVAGVIIGVAATVISNCYHLINLPADVYSISYIPLNLDLRDLLLSVSLAISLSVVATIYPATAAARMRPAPLLRDS